MQARAPLTALNWPFQHLSRLVNVNSCDTVVVSGALSPALLRDAVALALRKHPLTNCRMVGRGWRAHWEHAAQPLPIDVRVETYPGADPDEHLLRNVWDEPLPPHGRPLRFHLTFAASRSYLQVVLPHTCTDARSGWRLLHDIAGAYTALARGTPFDDSPIDVASRQTETLVLGTLTRVQRLRHVAAAVVRTAQDLARRDRGWPVPRVPRGETGLLEEDLGADLLARLRGTARARGTTVHGLLCLAMLRAWPRTPGAGPWLRILDMFSVRSMARERIDDLFDTFVLPYHLRLDARWSDEEVLRGAARQVRALRRGGIYTEIYRFKLYHRFAPLVENTGWMPNILDALFKTNLVTTNPGVVPYAIDHFGDLPVEDVYSFPQLMPPARLLFIYTTFRTRFRLLVLYDKAVWPEGPRRDVVRPFLDAIDRLCAAPPAIRHGGSRRSEDADRAGLVRE